MRKAILLMTICLLSFELIGCGKSHQERFIEYKKRSIAIIQKEKI